MTVGERGPHGDHGQTGDTGKTGVVGARGAQGRMPRRVVAAFVALTAVFVLLLAGGGYLILEVREQADKNATALHALCAQREEIDQRITRTENVLRQVPGPEVFGIPRKLIIDGLRTSRSTRQNLEILDC